MICDLIRRSEVLNFLDHRIRECVAMNCTTSVALNAEIATLQGVRKVVENMEVVDEAEECHLYEKVFGDGERREYRYGPEWVAQQLFMEGGYPTPEEAKAAWLRYEREGGKR